MNAIICSELYWRDLSLIPAYVLMQSKASFLFVMKDSLNFMMSYVSLRSSSSIILYSIISYYDSLDTYEN